MKNVTKVYSKTESHLNPSIPVRCPYCSAVTRINRLMAEPECKHFEDFTLFKKEEDAFCEIDDPMDKVAMSETIFRLSGSKYPNVVKRKTGELVETEEGMKLFVDGKFDSFLSDEEANNIFFPDEDDNEDADIIRGE